MPFQRHTKRLHVPPEILAGLFELPSDAKITFTAFDQTSATTVLFVESDTFPAIDEFDIPPAMTLKLKVHQWTSEITNHSETHCSVSIMHGLEATKAHFYGETALQQAEIYHIAQRQRAGLL